MFCRGSSWRDQRPYEVRHGQRQVVGRNRTAGRAAGGMELVVNAILATGLLNHPAHYWHWGPVQLSVPNAIVIILMVVAFVLALVVPFPKDHE